MQLKISRSPVSTRKPQHSKAYRPVRPDKPKAKSKTRRLPRLLGLGIALAGVASLSATAGALLAVSLSATPLMQEQLTDEVGCELAVNHCQRAFLYRLLKVPWHLHPPDDWVRRCKLKEGERQESEGRNAVPWGARTGRLTFLCRNKSYCNSLYTICIMPMRVC